ncbi:phage tail protein [Pantoea sp. Bo_7]|uniref:phage tail protein n=1 Tax=unclassified Pantoea TaxID=2630326 RepID=UPI0012319019|nr:MULTISPECIES: phage tail protein [unclassified Pantoea]KAA6046646.1 phage tail protein [Pantoea sp. Bo_7]KAA6091875.1 phage tail protein [Pantoea sp. Bo_10]
MTQKYYAIVTNLGAAKIANAVSLGTKLNITHMAVGDGGGVSPTPNASQTRLVNEVRRAALNSLTVDAANGSQIIAEQVIPETEGGFWIREMGLFDGDGTLIAVCNTADTYKPQLQEGSGRTQRLRMILIVSSTEAITLKVDPSVVLATRQYVDENVLEVRQYADSLMANHLAAADPHSQYAPKASPQFTGTPKAPTPAAGNNSTQLANTAFVQAALAALAGSAPAALDTLKELADALGNDPHFSATVLNALAGKMDIAKNGSDIADVAVFLKNLGLGEAAKRAVGTGVNQIPDMSSFLAQRGGAWYRQHPSGMIEQGGSFSVSGSASPQKVTVNFPIPFPSVCVGIWFTYQTQDPSSRFVGVFTKSVNSFVASIVCNTANTIYYRAEGY